ncbi:MAG: hypothetical protein AAF989_14930 [Planctomycetota bacterium]
MRKETILDVFPGTSDENRLVIATEQTGDEPGTVVLRQESFSEDVGWFVQNRVVIETCQVQGLKMALSGGSRAVCSELGCQQADACNVRPSRTASATILPFPAHRAG